MDYGNLIIKDWRNIDISFGLVYPNIYEIGISSYTVRLLYYLINAYDRIVCEQIYLPEKVKYPAQRYLDSRTQIRSIENQTLLEQFDILGFSLQFENDFKNVLWILEDSLIPITSQERQELFKQKGIRYPLIIGGGPVATSNPLPFSIFFDLFFIGDSEPNLGPFFKLFTRYLNNEIGYQKFLEDAKTIEGIFIPSLNNDVKRAVQRNLDLAPFPDYQILSRYTENKHLFARNFLIEVNRGCPFKCKFCISSFHNSPFRNRSYEKLTNAIDNGIKSSNFDKVSLIGSCVSAHPKFVELCEYILNKGKKFTIPSIRVEHLNSRIIKLLEQGNVKTITIAPETGSEKLRYLLDKKISNEQIYDTVKKICESKIRNIKFYFLIGLPDEDEEDIDATIKMLKEFDKLGFEKKSLRISINPLIPKLNTPYENKIDVFLNENVNKIKLTYQKIRKELKNLPSIKLKFQDIRDIINNAKLQAFISLGDKDISFLLKNYYLEGANFGALRKAEKLGHFTINDYFKKIKNGYSPWKI